MDNLRQPASLVENLIMVGSYGFLGGSGLRLSLGCLLMRTIASFLRYTVYLNFINGPISRVLLLILVHVQLLSCLFF